MKSKNTHSCRSATLASKSSIGSVIDWSWSFNMNQTNTATRHEIKQRCTRRRTTQRRTHTTKSQKKHKRKHLIYVETTYLDRKKGDRRLRGVILGQKMT